MPNYIKALIMVLVATSVVMFFARDPMTSHYSKEEFNSYRKMWWFLTACLFLSPGIWVFYGIAIIFFLSRRYVTDLDRVSLYIFLLFVSPSIPVEIPGVGGINYFIEIDLQRIMALFILWPIFTKSVRTGWFKFTPDMWIVLYVALCGFLYFRGDSVTHAVRLNVEMFIDIIIPYFAISRTIRSVSDFNRVLLAMMFTLSLIAAEAVMESVRHWELYNSTGHRLIGERIFLYTDERAGLLRARSIFMSPIVLGYAMIFLLGFLLYLKPYFTSKMAYRVLGGLGGLALLLSFSRGPWVGAVAYVVMYSMLCHGVGRAAIYMVAGAFMGYLVLAMTSFGQQILNLLPFFGGTARQDTFDYRARLLEQGIKVVKQNPILGNYNYLETPEMQVMRQGQGIIDTVNVFLTIAMSRGLVGLFFFVMIFVAPMYTIYKANKNLPANQKQFSQVGFMLISLMATSMLVIFTLSNADFVPILYYINAAFMAAWIAIYRSSESGAKVSSTMPVPAGERSLSTTKTSTT